jgi:hypothetical protein
MRSVLALGLLIALCAAANAATVQHVRTRDHVIVGRNQGVIRAGQGATAPGRFAVPGWSDEATRRWLDNASSGWSHAG